MSEKGYPLPFAGTGKKLLVTGIAGGFGISRRLSDMGLVIGSHVSVIGGGCGGPLVLDVKGSRLGVGFGVAQKIMVKEIQDEMETDISGERIAAKSSIID